ncbi:hypothetical protein [Streptomyces sp. LUP30]|uniref:hypothetical protein n=1 Tax=Streptomyces sp. LUP30 TaxID=1890285 RepID=UPI00085160BA|nr:hypothetical protein [Streptomyces sp. LUP30]
MGQRQDKQTIPVEDAFPVFQQRCRELHDEMLLARSHVAFLERQLAEAQEENTRLKEAADESRPASGGPDLAAVPPFPMGDGA